ncbi:hypothetical protein O9993_00830 [Vibrio lentus]|nr:hypothetical protein [Vibrio lentus]
MSIISSLLRHWIVERAVDVAVPRTKTALAFRSKYLINAILYTDTQSDKIQRACLSRLVKKRKCH